jgi:hypothetical protein
MVVRVATGMNARGAESSSASASERAWKRCDCGAARRRGAAARRSVENDDDERRGAQNDT